MSVNIKPYGLIVLPWLCVPALARDVGGFNTWLPAGTLCRVPIEKVHSTQFAVSFWEVNHRAADIARQSRMNLDNHRGRGPLDVEQLPQKVTGLTDDPYRSLAWAVRKRGGFQKTTASFSEFQWANISALGSLDISAAT
jgi:hypothetical protein